MSMMSNALKKIIELTEENEQLKHRLSNCIEPKFKIGQKVWSIFISQCFKDCKEICNLEITAIMKCNNGIYYQGYVLEQGKNRSDYWFNEKNTFLTKEEAKKHLEEIKNGIKN